MLLDKEEDMETLIHGDELERSTMLACDLTHDASMIDFSDFEGGCNFLDYDHHVT